MLRKTAFFCLAGVSVLTHEDTSTKSSDREVRAERAVLRAAWRKIEESNDNKALGPMYKRLAYRSSPLAFAQVIPEEVRYDAMGPRAEDPRLALCRGGGSRNAT